MSGFKKFLLRGNVIELATAVVIGAAFTSIVNSLVKDLLTPLISVFGGLPDFQGLTVQVGDAVFRYGAFINSLVSFVIVAAVVYFLVVQPYERLSTRFAKPAESTTRACPECLSDIPKAAVRCAHCTAQLAPRRLTEPARPGRPPHPEPGRLHIGNRPGAQPAASFGSYSQCHGSNGLL
ncbi:hypothetical protein Misp01_71580 [Microtetraspora sp. NBRC 13810]|uniref:large conductance mechanosensitive channel protein MscL n=1 Tax=Microtetraspora sp. NBRC 13810 TaxID=3030990 RepID=UPI0024A36DC3|nr:large conductance mechanosensitive channel protein MscL [Microtetraspora sp. NBRC 13810]GLW12030.1 hypothetical protein Misp01_71580 [Microtetraspora sp. NBRC 13810]